MTFSVNQEMMVKRTAEFFHRNRIDLRTGDKYQDSIPQALYNAIGGGFEPQFAPEVAGIRTLNSENRELWANYIDNLSLRATGKTKQGSKVVVYAHVPHHFSDPDNIQKAISDGLYNGAGRIPKEEFYRLIDMDGQVVDGIKRVWVIDYDALRKSESGVIPVKKALKHPQTIPFVGGEDQAEAYLKEHVSTYNTENIGVWHSDDMADDPRGRLLVFGDNGNDGLSGLYLGGSDARFLGVKAAEPLASEKSAVNELIKRPTLEEALRILNNPDLNRQGMIAAMEQYYQR